MGIGLHKLGSQEKDTYTHAGAAEVRKKNSKNPCMKTKGKKGERDKYMVGT